MSRSAYSVKLFALLGGFAGGVVAAVFVLPFLARFDFWNGNHLIGSLGVAPEKIIERVEEKTIIVPQQDIFVEAVKKTGPSVVSVQVFAGGRMIRSGSGIILTQDGLIATLTALVPIEAEVVQIAGGGSSQSGEASQIWRGKVEKRDYRSGVALVSVPASGLAVARMNTNLPAVASGLLALGKTFRLGIENVLVEEALVSWADERVKNFGISTGFNGQLYGAALIGGNGNILGFINFVNQKPIVIFSSQIQGVLDEYLSRSKRNN